MTIPGNEYMWLMDSEFCCKCGCLLAYFESDLCSFCYDDLGRQEQQDVCDNWDYMAQDDDEVKR